MLRSIVKRSSASLVRPISSSYSVQRGFSSESAPERKVAVLGAAGGIGQPLALLMKLNPLVSRLALYDIAGTPGVAADVSHINTRSEVFFYSLFSRFVLSLCPCCLYWCDESWFLNCSIGILKFCILYFNVTFIFNDAGLRFFIASD